MVATTKNIAALGILTGLLGAAIYLLYKEYKENPQPKVTTATMFGNQQRYKQLDGLGVGRSYTFPRKSMPTDQSFVKEV